MSVHSTIFWCTAGWVLAAAPALGSDANAGKSLFRERCSVCHTAEAGDNGGAQGPSLIGVIGRAAASKAQFPYTAALRDSKLTWDSATLNRFLAAPTSVVPGTSMLLAVQDKADRDNLIAYFQSVSSQAAPAESPIAVPESSTQSANWRLDAPGSQHHISAASLPAAFATPSARNNSFVVPKPASASLSVPPGFHVDTFISSLTGPRKMLVASNGDILVTEMRAGRVTVLHPSSDGSRVAGTDVYLQGLKQPFGLAFYPSAQNPQWLYVAETNRVTRYAFQVGDVKPGGGE
jgi:cytochrome c2